MELQLSETQRARLLELYQSLQLDYSIVNIQMTPTQISIQTNFQQTSLTIPTHYCRTCLKTLINISETHVILKLTLILNYMIKEIYYCS